MNTDNSYDKYIGESDQFFYDEGSSKKSTFLKQDSELFDEDSNVPGKCIEVKRVQDSKTEDWKVFVDGKEFLVLKGVRFTSAERDFFRKPNGMLFIINGIKSGWNSVSEFKRKIKE